MPESCSASDASALLADLTLVSIEKLLKKARRHHQEAEQAEAQIFTMLRSLGIEDAENIPSQAENAENLAEAISCYLQYGEYSIANIKKEIKEALRLSDIEKSKGRTDETFE